MWSNILDRISFWSLFITVVFMPVFFVPFAKVPVENAKGALLVLGLSVSIIFWAAARFNEGKIVLPKSWLLLSSFGLVFALLLSAFFSGNFSLSFFGVMFDVHTVSYMLALALFMFFSSIIFMDRQAARMLFFGLMLSLSVMLVFQLFRFIAPSALSLGILGGKTDNLFGSWNSLGAIATLLTIFSVFGFEFFALSKRLKYFFGISAILGLFFLMCVDFYLSWMMLGIFALIIFVFKVTFAPSPSKEKEVVENKEIKFPMFPFVMILVSLLFIISGQFISRIIPDRLELLNNEVNPNFTGTLNIAGKAIVADPVFGIGPNRFEELWTKYKPPLINQSQFWNASFSAGSGSIPTSIATTGAIGAVAWILFLVLLVWYGLKALFSKVKLDFKWEMMVFFLGALYLFVTAIFYSGGPAMLSLAFASAGVFVGLSSYGKSGEKITINLLSDPKKSIFSILILVLLMFTVAGFSFKFVERFASIPYFINTTSAEDIEEAEQSITRALSLHQNDLYFRTFSRVELAKLQVLTAKLQGGEEFTEEDKVNFKSSFDQAVLGANGAINKNPNNPINHEMLGSVYGSMVPFGVEGSYENSINAFTNASNLDPLSARIKLSMANISLLAKKTKEARSYAEEALLLKANYVDALIAMSQIEQLEGNGAKALAYAKEALFLLPENENLKDYVSTLEPRAEENTKDSEETNEKEKEDN